MTEDRQWDYAVTACVRVVDGDTYYLTLSKDMDFGFRMIEHKEWTADFRLLGFDAWEHNQAGGAKATSDAKAWITYCLSRDLLRGQTYKTDHFGRWLIDLYRTDTGEHLADYLRSQGDEKIMEA